MLLGLLAMKSYSGLIMHFLFISEYRFFSPVQIIPKMTYNVSSGMLTVTDHFLTQECLILYKLQMWWSCARICGPADHTLPNPVLWYFLYMYLLI